MSSKNRQSSSGGRSGESTRVKDSKESPPVPDSTTEPAPRPPQRFQEGEEVFYQTETGQQMLGTVQEIRGETCVVHFDDGTEKLAQLKRLRKFFDEEEDLPAVECKRKKIDPPVPVVPPQPRPQHMCTSCGTSRRISANKAKLYENDLRKFECRMCVKNKAANRTRVELLSQMKAKSTSDIASRVAMTSPSSGFQALGRLSPKIAQSSMRPIQFSIISTKNHYCFSCEQLVQPFDSVGCNLCGRPCHLSCLRLSPTPLNGDTFWHLICSTCGNQNARESVERKFTARRSISSWGDVAYLLISCLSVVQTHRMFDFEREILPFMERNLESLHIPLRYKSQPPEKRTEFILTALRGCPRRFQNGKEFRLKTSLWGIREIESSFKCTFASTIPHPPMGVKPERPLAKIGSAHAQLPASVPLVNPSPDLLRFIASTKNKGLCPSPVPNPKEDDTSDTTSRSDTTETASERDWATATEETRSDIFPIPETRSESSRSFTSSAASTTSACSTISSVSSSRKVAMRKEKSGGTRVRSDTLESCEGQRIMDKRKAQAAERIYRKRKYSEGSNSPIKKSSNNSSPVSKPAAIAVLKRPKIENLPTSPARNLITKGVIRTIMVDKGGKKNSHLPPWKSVPASPCDTDNDDDMPLSKLKLRIDIPSSRPLPVQRAIKTASSCPVSPRQLQELRAIESITNFDEPVTHGFALKSSATTPLSPLQFQEALVNVAKDEAKKERKAKKAKKAKLASREGDSSTASSLKKAGRPKLPSSTVSPVASVNPKSESVSGANRALRPSKPPKTSTIPIASRRVGTFNGISERRPEPLPLKEDMLLLNFLNEALFEAGLLAGYRIQCLPTSPQTEVDRRTETLQVFSHLRIEKETATAAALLSRSVSETRSLTRRKSELLVGTQKHNLNDLDSYEVLGKRVDSEGIARYQVLWKKPDDDDESMDEDYTGMTNSSVIIEPHPFSALNLFASSAQKGMEFNDIPTTTESLWEAVEKSQLVNEASIF